MYVYEYVYKKVYISEACGWGGYIYTYMSIYIYGAGLALKAVYTFIYV
jgi:hypothetical protein